jgi:glycosyltransferase involved in cell wall biosynthesis
VTAAERPATERTSAPPPVVSVVIPCYLQAAYLAEAVESVVGQTYGDWEIVIVDDGSTDATAAVAEGLIAAHPDRRIRLLRQANAGVAVARNNGIAASSGRYILPLDADDVLLPAMLERTVGLLDAEPGVAIAYTDYRRFGTEEGVVAAGPWTVEELCYRCPLSSTSLYRREVWTATGGYNPNMRDGYEDWDFWIGAAEHGFAGRRIPEPLWKYRKALASRNVAAIRREPEILGQIARNHPRLFTRRRRLRNWVRRNAELFPGRARYWSGRLVGALRRRARGRQHEPHSDDR